jgi:hypothetical protein
MTRNLMSSKQQRSASVVDDGVMEQALVEFRQSVHNWSEAAYNRPREVRVAVRRSWRLAVGWALGCVLAAGSLSGGIYEHHRLQVEARMAAEAQAAKERQLQVKEKSKAVDEDLMAAVDSDVSREVPAAMEPLAQLMDGDESK